jgi:hypothetical protein
MLGAAKMRPLLVGLSLYDGMAALVSMVVLLAALALILDESSQDNQKWAYGAVGSIVGHWLKPSPTPARRPQTAHSKRATQAPPA